MKIKKVNRYYCDFCKKSGCSGGHMKRHEKRCTMNPHRICGMCKMLGQDQPQISDLVSLLPNPEDYKGVEYGIETFTGTKAVNEALPYLRGATGGCPACIMAAIRQSGIPVPAVSGFNFTEECNAFWAQINEENRREEYL